MLAPAFTARALLAARALPHSHSPLSQRLTAGAAGAQREVFLTELLANLAVGEAAILLRPPLPFVGVVIWMERERQPNDRAVAITGQANLQQRKQPMTHLKAVVWVRPTADNVVALCEELREPKYAEYHISFSNALPDQAAQLQARYRSVTAAAPRWGGAKEMIDPPVPPHLHAISLFAPGAAAPAAGTPHPPSRPQSGRREGFGRRAGPHSGAGSGGGWCVGGGVLKALAEADEYDLVRSV